MSFFALFLSPSVFPSSYPLRLEKLLGKGWTLEECCGGAQVRKHGWLFISPQQILEQKAECDPWHTS